MSLVRGVLIAGGLAQRVVHDVAAEEMSYTDVELVMRVTDFAPVPSRCPSVTQVVVIRLMTLAGLSRLHAGWGGERDVGRFVNGLLVARVGVLCAPMT